MSSSAVSSKSTSNANANAPDAFAQPVRPSTDASSAGGSSAAVPSRPVLPSHQPSQASQPKLTQQARFAGSRLPPEAEARLRQLSMRLAGGNANALTPAEMQEFRALAGGGFWSAVGSWVDPRQYSFYQNNLSFGQNAYRSYNHIFDRYGKLRQQVQELQGALMSPMYGQMPAMQGLGQELAIFLREIDNEVAALQINRSRAGPNALYAESRDLDRLKANEQKLSQLAEKFKAFTEEAKRFNVQQTAYPQQAVQQLLNQPYQPYQPYQPPTPSQYQPPSPPSPSAPYQPQPTYQPQQPQTTPYGSQSGYGQGYGQGSGQYGTGQGYGQYGQYGQGYGQPPSAPNSQQFAPNGTNGTYGQPQFGPYGQQSPYGYGQQQQMQDQFIAWQKQQQQQQQDYLQQQQQQMFQQMLMNQQMMPSSAPNLVSTPTMPLQTSTSPFGPVSAPNPMPNNSVSSPAAPTPSAADMITVGNQPIILPSEPDPRLNPFAASPGQMFS